MDGWPPGKTGRFEPGSVRRYRLKSVTDRLYVRYRADSDVNESNQESEMLQTCSRNSQVAEDTVQFSLIR